jgi:hypothetical protein
LFKFGPMPLLVNEYRLEIQFKKVQKVGNINNIPMVGSRLVECKLQALKYRSVTDIVRPIREIVRCREEATRHSVQHKWNWGLLFVRPECIGVRPNCSFVQRKSKYMYPSPGLEARMLNGKSEDYWVLYKNIANQARDGERNGEVENRLKLSNSYCCSGKQVNCGLKIINMNDTNYLISSQHLPFRINTLCWYSFVSFRLIFESKLNWRSSDICPTQTQRHRTFCQTAL